MSKFGIRTPRTLGFLLVSLLKQSKKSTPQNKHTPICSAHLTSPRTQVYTKSLTCCSRIAMVGSTKQFTTNFYPIPGGTRRFAQTIQASTPHPGKVKEQGPPVMLPETFWKTNHRRSLLGPNRQPYPIRIRHLLTHATQLRQPWALRRQLRTSGQEEGRRRAVGFMLRTASQTKQINPFLNPKNNSHKRTTTKSNQNNHKCLLAKSKRIAYKTCARKCSMACLMRRLLWAVSLWNHAKKNSLRIPFDFPSPWIFFGFQSFDRVKGCVSKCERTCLICLKAGEGGSESHPRSVTVSRKNSCRL